MSTSNTCIDIERSFNKDIHGVVSQVTQTDTLANHYMDGLTSFAIVVFYVAEEIWFLIIAFLSTLLLFSSVVGLLFVYLTSNVIRFCWQAVHICD